MKKLICSASVMMLMSSTLSDVQAMDHLTPSQQQEVHRYMHERNQTLPQALQILADTQLAQELADEDDGDSALALQLAVNEMVRLITHMLFPHAHHGAYHGAQHGAQHGAYHGAYHGAQHGAQHGAYHGAQHGAQHGVYHGAQHGAQHGVYHGVLYHGVYHGVHPEAHPPAHLMLPPPVPIENAEVATPAQASAAVANFWREDDRGASDSEGRCITSAMTMTNGVEADLDHGHEAILPVIRIQDKGFQRVVVEACRDLWFIMFDQCLDCKGSVTDTVGYLLDPANATDLAGLTQAAIKLADFCRKNPGLIALYDGYKRSNQSDARSDAHKVGLIFMLRTVVVGHFFKDKNAQHTLPAPLPTLRQLMESQQMTDAIAQAKKAQEEAKKAEEEKEKEKE